jgi:chromosomal replication initiation ATPase DnaA
MITEVSRLTMVHVDDILGDSRMRHIVTIRHAYWYLLQQNGFSLSEIGRMNNRTHSTILAGINNAKVLISIGDKDMTRIYGLIKDIKR